MDYNLNTQMNLEFYILSRLKYKYFNLGYYANLIEIILISCSIRIYMAKYNL